MTETPNLLTLTPGTLQQSSFSKCGDGYKYDGIELSTKGTKTTFRAAKPIVLNPGTKIIGDEKAVIQLIAKASEKIWPAGTPIFSFSGNGYQFEKFTFDGNAKNQIVEWGDGYHNLFGGTNASDVKITKVTAQNSLGDMARIRSSKNITFEKNTILGIGHDGLFVEQCTDVDAHDNVCYTRINSALRSRGSSNVTFRNNWIYSNKKYTPRTGPGIQVQIDQAGNKSTNVQVYENWIEGCEGPGMWIVTHSRDYTKSSDISIHNNVIKDCGQMQAVNKLPGVAGICLDGWNADIFDNTIDGCYGAGIRIGNYITTSVGDGYKVSLKGNIITNTRKANYPDKYSGIGLVNVRTNHEITSDENCLYGNISGNYSGTGISSANDILKDPLFVNGYHLQSSNGHYTIAGIVKDAKTSPCISEGYELGRYNKTAEASVYNPIQVIDPGEVIGDNPSIILVGKDGQDLQTLSEELEDVVDDDIEITYLPK